MPERDGYIPGVPCWVDTSQPDPEAAVDFMDAGRMAVFADPEGAAFFVWQARENKGAQIVNEHGSLNFNALNTRDVEGAKSFYGSVFGWQALALPGGAEMWTLPGYGDYLEQLHPG